MTDAARPGNFAHIITVWARLVKILCFEVGFKRDKLEDIGGALQTFRDRTRKNAKRTEAYSNSYRKLEDDFSEDDVTTQEILDALPDPDQFDAWKETEPRKSLCEALEDLILLSRPTDDTIVTDIERTQLQQELAANLRANLTLINNEEGLDDDTRRKIDKESEGFLAEINTALSTAGKGEEAEPEPAGPEPERPPPLVRTENDDDSARPEGSDTEDSMDSSRHEEESSLASSRHEEEKEEAEAGAEEAGAEEAGTKKAGAEEAGTKKAGAEEKAADKEEEENKDPPGLTPSDNDDSSSESGVPPLPTKTPLDGPGRAGRVRVIEPLYNQPSEYWTFESLQSILARNPEEAFATNLCQEPFWSHEKQFSRLLDLRDEMETKGLPHAFDYKRIMAMILRTLATEFEQLRVFLSEEEGHKAYIQVLAEMDEEAVLWFLLQLTARQQYRYRLVGGKYAQLVDNFMAEWSRANKCYWKRYDNISVDGPTERPTLDDEYFERYFTNISQLAATLEGKAESGEDDEDKDEDEDENEDEAGVASSAKAGKPPAVRGPAASAPSSIRLDS